MCLTAQYRMQIAQNQVVGYVSQKYIVHFSCQFGYSVCFTRINTFTSYQRGHHSCEYILLNWLKSWNPQIVNPNCVLVARKVSFPILPSRTYPTPVQGCYTRLRQYIDPVQLSSTLSTYTPLEHRRLSPSIPALLRFRPKFQKPLDDTSAAQMQMLAKNRW